MRLWADSKRVPDRSLSNKKKEKNVKIAGLLSVVLVIVIVEALSNFLLCFHRFSLSSLSLAISLSGDSCHLSVGVVNNWVNFFKDVLLEAIGDQVWPLTQFFSVSFL